MAPRRALARRAKRLIGYWRSETRTIRQGLVALVLSTAAGFVAVRERSHELVQGAQRLGRQLSLSCVPLYGGNQRQPTGMGIRKARHERA
jgi:hypothetical protein